MTLRNFHEGEARIQAESGVDTVAFDRMVDEAFRPELSDNEVRFVSGRTFSVGASIDADGRAWASPFFGRAGELFTVLDPTTVGISTARVDGDPLIPAIAATGHLGVLYFEPSRRRRAKSLGMAEVDARGGITYRMHRNFGLCNKYIAKRDHDPERPSSAAGRPGRRDERLSADDCDQLAATDMVFLASFHERHGVDPTHRGGPPGFVTVVDDRTISMPDYTGNGMFQTLGNLLLDDRLGVMTFDPTTGRTLHLTGRGRVEASPAADEYSTRTLVLEIDEVRGSHPDAGTWGPTEAYELRPGLINPATPYLA